MRSRLFFASLCAAASFAAAASAQDAASAPDPAKLALARQVVAATTGGPETIKARMSGMFATMNQMVKSQLPPEETGIENSLFKYMTDEELKTVPAMLDDMAEVYAEQLTETELKDMLAWLTSPSGRSINAKTAAISQELLLRQGPRMKAMMAGLTKTVIDRACADAHCTADQRQILTQVMQKALPQS